MLYKRKNSICITVKTAKMKLTNANKAILRSLMFIYSVRKVLAKWKMNPYKQKMKRRMKT